VPPLHRTIAFYRYYLEQDEDQIGRLAPERLCRQLRQANPPLVPLPNEDGVPSDDVALYVEIGGEATDRFSMLRVKFRGHPYRFNRNTFQRTRLNLEREEGLGSPTHFRFFRDNVIAVELNRDGPPPTSLATYLMARGGDAWSRFRMKRIPDAEAIERLNPHSPDDFAVWLSNSTRFDLELAYERRS
jgi:hypothetical protein